MSTYIKGILFILSMLSNFVKQNIEFGKFPLSSFHIMYCQL